MVSGGRKAIRSPGRVAAGLLILRAGRQSPVWGRAPCVRSLGVNSELRLVIVGFLEDDAADRLGAEVSGGRSDEDQRKVGERYLGAAGDADLQG